MLATETRLFEQTMDNIAKAFEVVGFAVIGGVDALLYAMRAPGPHRVRTRSGSR